METFLAYIYLPLRTRARVNRVEPSYLPTATRKFHFIRRVGAKLFYQEVEE